jgi:hypothetical protein
MRKIDGIVTIEPKKMQAMRGHEFGEVKSPYYMIV